MASIEIKEKSMTYNMFFLSSSGPGPGPRSPTTTQQTFFWDINSQNHDCMTSNHVSLISAFNMTFRMTFRMTSRMIQDDIQDDTQDDI